MNLSLLSARSFPRKASQTSIFLQEWDIPFEQLEIGELIGKGRFGQVYHGRWHGEVAIRLIDIERDNEEQLKAFKREVMAYRQTRHENVVLFMGACMSPPHLAIITRSVLPGVPHPRTHSQSPASGRVEKWGLLVKAWFWRREHLQLYRSRLCGFLRFEIPENTSDARALWADQCHGESTVSGKVGKLVRSPLWSEYLWNNSAETQGLHMKIELIGSNQALADFFCKGPSSKCLWFHGPQSFCNNCSALFTWIKWMYVAGCQ